MAAPQRLILELKITPKSSRDAVLGWLGEALKIAVTAPPENGKANAAVLAVLARTLDVPGSSIELLSGHGTARKRVAISGLDAAELRRRIDARSSGR